MQKYCVFSLAGTGKTYIAERYKNAAELVPMDYKRIFEPEYADLPHEQKKLCPHYTLNPKYPQNYIDAVFDAFKTHNVVMITLLYETAAMLFDVLSYETDMQIVLAYPKPEDYAAYRKRWINRGNTEAFLNHWEESFFESSIKFFQQVSDHEHIVLGNGEYLDAALKRHGVELIPNDEDNEEEESGDWIDLTFEEVRKGVDTH